MKKLWFAVGGRKFLGLLLACTVYLVRGTFDEWLAYVFIAYMCTNVLAKKWGASGDA